MLLDNNAEAYNPMHPNADLMPGARSPGDGHRDFGLPGNFVNGGDCTERATILVVDDLPENLALMNNLLKHDYKVKIANRAGQALEIAASDPPPNLILLDIIMPDMTGYEVCRQLKRDPRTRNIPVIFLTARSEVEDEKKGLELGAVDYITKPISPAIVMARVRNHLALKTMADGLRDQNDKLEMRVEQRTEELRASQKQTLHAEKLSAIGKLSASIAHEFNNPLQGIISILKGLKRRAIMDVEDMELLDAAISESDRIKNLIRNLQEFNRPSSGKKMMMDVHKSLDAMLLLQSSDLKGRRITLGRHYAEALPRIMAVQDQIKQVFLNLLANAADACPPAGGELTVSTWQENERVAVAIKDTGSGIKPEDRERIFQPFFSTKPAVKGTGLGLSVCHGIIQDHQGEIRVESQPGHGTTFIILLPIEGDRKLLVATDQ